MQTEGLPAFVRRAFLFVVRSFFSYGNYYIYEKTLNDANELQFTPKIQNCNLKILSTPEEVDELIAEGFHINAYLAISETKARISRRAILFCVFVGKELAHRSWVTMSNETRMDMLPYAVDFRSEVCLGSTDTYPKYRGLGIYTYVYSEIYKFLKEKGWSKARFSSRTDNTAVQKAQAKLASRIYARGRYLRLLQRKVWKEEPIEKIKE